ncbi:MAG: hypothetical protein ACPG5B_06860 [Chitinophagales bacterium]
MQKKECLNGFDLCRKTYDIFMFNVLNYVQDMPIDRILKKDSGFFVETFYPYSSSKVFFVEYLSTYNVNDFLNYCVYILKEGIRYELENGLFTIYDMFSLEDVFFSVAWHDANLKRIADSDFNGNIAYQNTVNFLLGRYEKLIKV